MYKISVPIMSATVNDTNREKYLQLCKEAGAERIFLVSGSIMEPVPGSLSENVGYFKSEGFEVGIWTDTIGHGVVLDHVEQALDTSAFLPIVDVTGEARPHTNCPLDRKFRRHIANHIAELAKTGADIVMLDDDFRMSQHGSHLCCACPAHIERIGEILGVDISREELLPYIFSGKQNKYRDAWLKAQNDGLVELAQEIRSAVDRESPNVNLCFCTALTPWNADGTDIARITRILSGKHPPLLRLTGAPYWAVKKFQYPLIAVFEIARMLASFVCNEEFELMSEGDVYPRPRYTCPASYLELYDAVTRIDGGYSGILKYMFDYVAGPDFETGYLHFHKENRPLREALATLFPNGANTGVRIVTYPHTVGQSDHDLAPLRMISPRPMLGSCSIPTIYRGKGVCNCVFGENARHIDLAELQNGTILDAVSACILSKRGVDVGLASFGGFGDKKISFLCTDDAQFKSFITDGAVKMLHATCKNGIEPLLFSAEPKGKQTVAYRYENDRGERFLVFLFEGGSIISTTSVCLSGLVKNPVTQQVLLHTIPWVAQKPLPAYSEKNPELYLMCAEDRNSLSVAFFNCFADSLANPVITLGDQYDRIECIGCEAELEGNTVTIKSKVNAFAFAAFRVYKGERGCSYENCNDNR